uniref:Uncharacterized protein n=1 Tax=Romanomermis culicivorax TaxID=13658 RepID=A0A915KF45_ROMCU
MAKCRPSDEQRPAKPSLDPLGFIGYWIDESFLCAAEKDAFQTRPGREFLRIRIKTFLMKMRIFCQNSIGDDAQKFSTIQQLATAVSKAPGGKDFAADRAIYTSSKEDEDAEDDEDAKNIHYAADFTFLPGDLITSVDDSPFNKAIILKESFPPSTAMPSSAIMSHIDLQAAYISKYDKAVTATSANGV